MPHTLTFQQDECDEAIALIDSVPITTIIADYETQHTFEGQRKGETTNDLGFFYAHINHNNTVADLPLTTRENAVLLVCACTYPECGSTTVDVQVTDTQVIWSNIKTRLSKKQPYPNLGPWTFDLTQYRKACEDLHTRLKAFPEPGPPPH